MGTLFIALRTLVYVTAFVGFFAWLALRVRLLDQRLGLELPSWVQGPGVILMVAGGVLVLMCAVQFVWRGGGTPAVFDAPRRFVGSGPYRFVRNPMYLGGLTTLAGLGLFLHSGAVLIFSGAMFLAFHLFVIFYEEPVLERQFGASYVNYKATTHRWFPKWPARSPVAQS